jgi:tetratricopeptide (TPR) repeat protein
MSMPFALAVMLVLVAPFGEGGRRPDVLAALQALAFALGAAAAIATAGRRAPARPRGRGTWILAVACALPGWSIVAAFHAAFPYAALLGVLDRLATLSALLAGAVLFGDGDTLRRLRLAVVAATSIQSVVALAGAIDSGPAGASRIFLNRSQLAAYLAIGIFLAAAAALGAARRGARRAALLWSGVVLLHAGALLPLQSRGALVALACGAPALVLPSWRDLPRRGRWLVPAAIGLVLLVGALLVARRFAQSDDPDRYTRLPIWSASLAMACAHPVAGLGPGQFAHEAPRHNFPLARSPVRYGRQFSGAHSFPLTLLAEEGMPALLLAAALLAGLFATFLGAARRGDDVLIGILAALAALSAHGLVEDLQERPAILLTAALLAGAGCAAARGWRLRSALRPVGELDLRAAGAIGLAWGCLVAGVVVGPWLAWRDAAAARAAGAAGLPRLERAARLDPMNPWHREGLAMAALQGGPPDRERYASAAIELDAARALAPREPRPALLRARLEAVAARSLFPAPATSERAAAFYDEAVRLAPSDPRPRLEQAGFLAEQGRTDEARATLEAALALEPHFRRARILLADLLEREGNAAAARLALDALLASDAALRDYVPDSPYAAEIVRDAPAERQRIRVALAPASPSRSAS